VCMPLMHASASEALKWKFMTECQKEVKITGENLMKSFIGIYGDRIRPIILSRPEVLSSWISTRISKNHG
jgi:hypothetical protein